MVLYYHASQAPNLNELTPYRSNHGKSLIYFSSKRENVLVYLSNAVEKHCKEIGFKHNGIYRKWASYGFENEVLCLEEYYPNATIETYKGVCGYIYSAASVESIEKQSDIPYAFTTEKSVTIDYCEYIHDAYDAIIEAVNKGEMILGKYEESSREKMDWIKAAVKNEYATYSNHPEYRSFLQAKFADFFL